MAQLPFNPAAKRATFAALVRLPMAPAAGRWARGKGTLVLDDQLAGQMRVDYDRWPELKKGTGR